MGPRQGDDEEVLGRYAIHFHADEGGSRGSVVDGVAVYDSTGHAFAAHLSDGVTFRECVAHDLVDDAFWWDLSLDGGGRDLVPSQRHRVRALRRPLREERRQQQVQPHRVPDGCRRRQRRPRLRGHRHAGRRRVVGRLPLAVALARREHVDVRGQRGPQQPPQRDLLLAERRPAHDRRPGSRPTTAARGSSPGRTPTSRRTGTARSTPAQDEGLVISALPAKKGENVRRDDHLRGHVHRPGRTAPTTRSTITKHLARGGRVTEISGSTFKGGRKAQIGLPDGGDHPQLYDIGGLHVRGQRVLARRRRVGRDRAQRPRLERRARSPCGGPIRPASPARSGTRACRRTSPAAGITTAGRSRPSNATERRRFGCSKRAASAARQRSGIGGGAGRRWRLTLTKSAGSHGRNPRNSRIAAERRRRVGEEVLAAHDEQTVGREEGRATGRAARRSGPWRRRSTAATPPGRASGSVGQASQVGARSGRPRPPPRRRSRAARGRGSTMWW